MFPSHHLHEGRRRRNRRRSSLWTCLMQPSQNIFVFFERDNRQEKRPDYSYQEWKSVVSGCCSYIFFCIQFFGEIKHWKTEITTIHVKDKRKNLYLVYHTILKCRQKSIVFPFSFQKHNSIYACSTSPFIFSAVFLFFCSALLFYINIFQFSFYCIW